MLWRNSCGESCKPGTQATKYHSVATHHQKNGAAAGGHTHFHNKNQNNRKRVSRQRIQGSVDKGRERRACTMTGDLSWFIMFNVVQSQFWQRADRKERALYSLYPSRALLATLPNGESLAHSDWKYLKFQVTGSLARST